jgi:hypothetical protein
VSLDQQNTQGLSNLSTSLMVSGNFEGTGRSRNVQVFFYGLFMDEDLLVEMGLHPMRSGSAELPDFQIRIGERATLIPSPGSISYGVVVELPKAEVFDLYSKPHVRDYCQEPVNAIMIGDRSIQHSVCYNLPPDKPGAGVNAAYAEKLAELVLRLGFPSDYAKEIIRQGDA